MLGDLAGPGCAAQPDRQRLDGPPDRDLGVLQAAGHAQGPRAVPEVPLDLTGDGGHGEAEEVGAPARVEPVEGAEQADRRDLLEVLAALPPPAVAPGDVAGDGQVSLCETVPLLTAAGIARSTRGERREQRLEMVIGRRVGEALDGHGGWHFRPTSGVSR